MKKIFTIITLFLTMLTIAQDEEKNYSTIEKGSWNLSGNFALNSSNFNFENTNQNDTKNTMFSINPQIGYAISKNLMFGLGLGYTFNLNEHQNALNSEFKRNTYQINTYLKKLFPITNNLTINVLGEIGYMKSNLEYDPSNDESNSFSIGFRPGFSLFLSRKIALETQIGFLGYSHSKNESSFNSAESTSNSFNLNLNSNNLLFGVTYFFR